ncbi:hypothetical protein VTN77DRAFT_4606 [Rasamsonia byssochlamydoides]|uniref:uncharacterized protein n=1 Tax=Rasamsonia byssochlamydoides TaxID=89139 RepID=UPI0037442BC9
MYWNITMAARTDDPKAASFHVENIQRDHSPLKRSFFVKSEAKSVLSVPLQEAIAKQNPRIFTRRTCQLYVCMTVSMMIAWANGYDGSLMSGINAMPQYQKYFGAEMTGGSTGIVFAVYFIGNLAAAAFTGPLGDHLGRRWGMWIGALFIAAGACAQVHGFMGGRFCCGFGIGLGQASGITYIAEIAHPAWRSGFTSMFNTFYFVGAFVVSWVTYATLDIQSDYAWRIPIYLQCFASGCILLAAPFITESPRWLLAHGRREDALAMLTKYHGEGDPESPIVKLEMEEMTADINLEGRDKVWWDYRPLFNTREARWRIACVVGMALVGQWAAMLDQAGIKSSWEQLLYNAVLNTLAYPYNAASFFNTYVTPIGLKNAQWKFYFLYIIWDALIPIFIYLVFVETHGRTLEELTEIFRGGYAVLLQQHSV